MWIAIGVIALCIIMLVGPIMMVRPTPGQRALTDLRARAQKMGMRVQMTPNPTGDDPKYIASYCLAVPVEEQDANKPPQVWRLVRKGFEHEMHFAGVWECNGLPELPLSAQQALSPLMGSLPDSVCSLEKSRLGASVAWHERRNGREVDDVLEALLKVLRAMNELSSFDKR